MRRPAQRVAVHAEAAFVSACVREPDAIGADEIRAVAALVQDWTRVVRLAAAHGVSEFVRVTTNRAGVSLPPGTASALREQTIATLLRVMLLDRLLVRIAGVFSAERIPLLVLKGPVLVRTIYRGRAFRPYSDLDIVVPEGEEDRATRHLVACGLTERPYETEISRRAHAHHGADASFHRTFLDESRSLLVELHVDPLQLGVRPLCEAERWQHSKPAPDYVHARMLAPEHQLVQLSVHAHKHAFNRLIWLKDVDLLLRRYAQVLDWDQVRWMARQEGVAGSVWYAVELAGQVLGSPQPTAVRDLAPAPHIRVLYGLVWPAVSVAALESQVHWRAVQFRVADSLRGMVPSLVLLGRRGERARTLARSILLR